MAAPPLAALIEVRYFHLLEMFTGKIGFPLKVESKLNRLFLMDFKSTQSKDLDSFWLTRCYLHSKAWELLLSHSRCDKTAIHTDETMWKVSQVLQMTNLLMMSVWVYPAKKEEEKQTNKQTICDLHSPLIVLLVHQTWFLQQVLLHVCAGNKHKCSRTKSQE